MSNTNNKNKPKGGTALVPPIADSTIVIWDSKDTPTQKDTRELAAQLRDSMQEAERLRLLLQEQFNG